MILISRKVDYALLILSHLARSGEPCSARELAERYRLSRPFTANILKDLTQHGFVSSQRGVHGGYRLERLPEDITLAQVIESLEGPFQFMGCAEPLLTAAHEHQCAHGDEELADDLGSGKSCQLVDICPVRSPLRAVHNRLVAVLQEISVADLVEDAPMLVPLQLETEPSLS